MSPRVLFVTSECAPWSKTGGLADVSASLPAALRNIGVDARVLTPVYSGMPDPTGPVVARVPARAALPDARVVESQLPNGVPAMLVECAPLYARRGGPYQDVDGSEWPDNALRFAQLARVAALVASGDADARWKPDVIHGNDWQGALAPVYLRYGAAPRAASLLTIHNLAFQGVFPAQVASEVGLPPGSFAEVLEFHGRSSFLKGGLVTAGAITTVSPTYAREIQTEELGMGLAGVLRERSAELHGILNGIDTHAWDPARDAHLASRYDARSLERKRGNKQALHARCGWPDDDAPLLGLVSRLTHQKGIDLVLAAAPQLEARGARLVILGSGDPGLEAGVLDLARSRSAFAWARIGFDEPLAHLIEGGADLFLMPSRFEPSGMNQMYSQRYGTPPVVRATGGLLDSVEPFDVAAGTGAGFFFETTTPEALLGAIDAALEVRRHPHLWNRVRENGMARDFSWALSAARYRDLYLALRAKN